ncbi:MAG: O-antigen ligase family protein, partial [Bacteroidota bacterium]
MKEKKTLKENSINKFEGLYILLILILPFVYVKTIVDPVLIPRQILLSIFLLIAVLFLFFQKQKDGFQFSNKLIIAYGLLPIVYCVSIFQSINIIESYYTISKILLFSTFFILTTYLLVSGKIKFEIILKALIVFSCFIVVSTIIEVIKLRSTGVSVFKELNMYLITSTFGHKNLLSSAIFMCIPFLYAAFLSLNKSWKIAASINIFFGVLLIFMLQTRAVIAGMGLSFLITSFLSLFLFRGQKERKYIRMIGFGAIVVLLGFLFVAVKYSDKFSLLTKTESMRERVNIWHNTLEMIKEFPLIGVGAGNWQIHFPNYGLTRFYDVNFSISEGLTNFQRPHNDFLWVFSETGIFGFIIYCSIFILSIFYLFKLIHHSSELNQKIIYLLFLFTILGYVFIALIDFPLERMEHQILLG